MKGLLDTIAEQQKGHENDPIYMVGEQLLDMATGRADVADILLQDLQKKEMNLSAAAAKLKEYADKHRGKEKCYCITPKVAEKILREFYGLPEAEEEEGERSRREFAEEEEPVTDPVKQFGYIDLDSFL